MTLIPARDLVLQTSTELPCHSNHLHVLQTCMFLTRYAQMFAPYMFAPYMFAPKMFALKMFAPV